MESFEKNTPEKRTPRERLEETRKEKAGRWQARYEEKLDSVLNSDKIDRSALMDVLWEEGVLDRVAPEDREEKHARMQLEKAVWKGKRDDPELYWRILYSAAAVKNAIEKNYSIAAGSHSYVTGAFQDIYKIFSSPKAENAFPETKEGKNPAIIVIEELMDRAKKELEKRGVKPPEKMLQIGSKGKWNGMEVTIENYTDDGLIWLKADSPEDHMKLYKFTHGRGAPPDEINPDDFK